MQARWAWTTTMAWALWDNEKPIASLRPLTTPAGLAPCHEPKLADSDCHPTGQQNYYLASELSNITPITAICEKLMDTLITLNLHEVFVASSDISRWLNWQVLQTHRSQSWSNSIIHGTCTHFSHPHHPCQLSDNGSSLCLRFSPY